MRLVVTHAQRCDTHPLTVTSGAEEVKVEEVEVEVGLGGRRKLMRTGKCEYPRGSMEGKQERITLQFIPTKRNYFICIKEEIY